jgi:hypothetical protein
VNHRSNVSLKTAVVLISVVGWLSLGSTARAEEADGARFMPVPQQNAVLQKYCGVCHSDALMYGGLSVEHVDAAHPDPTVAAMLVSKLTSGLTPKDIEAATHGPDPDTKTMALLHGAMGASGSMPDEATQIAFGRALSAQAGGAEEWHSWRSDKPAPILTADIVRQIASTKFPGKVDMYRLILTCRVDTHEGEIKLAWANGVPEEGQPITVAVDGNLPFTHKAEGGKKQGNGAGGPGATILYPDPNVKLSLPAQTLTVSNLFPNETVVFPFADLSATVRRDLSGCFSPAIAARAP